MKITINMIAEKAGVSRGTVDKVIHGRKGVSDPVRQRVLQVVEEYQYKPNMLARQLRLTSRPRTLAIIIPHQSNPYFASLKHGMDEAADAYQEYRVTLRYYFSDGIHASELAMLLRHLEQEKPDGVIVRGIDDPEVRLALDQLGAAGIPVLTVDSDVPDSKRLCFVGENHLKSGRIAASLLAKCLNSRGQVAVVAGSRSIAAHQLRMEGFTRYLAEKAPCIEMVEVVETWEQSVITYHKTVDLLKKYPSLAGLFNVAGCSGDVAAALADCGRKGQVRVIGYNFTGEVVRLVKDGTFDFTIGLMPRRQGALAVERMLDFLLKGIRPRSKMVTQTLIGLDENVDSILDR
jgi:LacI family transcriptional regulator